MKKFYSLAIVLCMLLTLVCSAVVPAVAETPSYTVSAYEVDGLELDALTATDAPLTADGVTLAEDQAVAATVHIFLSVTGGGSVTDYVLVVDGQANTKFVQGNYNSGNDRTDLFINLPEGHYNEVIAKGSDDLGNTFDVIKLTNLTVTAPINAVPEIDEVDPNPCWSLTSADLSMGSGSNAVTVVDNTAYATYECGKTGDPYLSYISGSATKIGRYLLIKYQNNTIIPRMQIYIAQGGGITSDSNMIEFEIAANNSGWTYVIVDMSKNSFYNKDTMSVNYFRFDPLEARHVNGGSYKFSGEETIDIAYIKGFTTKAGLMSYLETNELHHVTKTATLIESQLDAAADGFTYTDKDGNVFPVTANGDGTYSYTFEANDVRTPIIPIPVVVLDGSRLVSETVHACELSYDKTTGIATYTATGGDPYFMLASQPATYARYMAVRYKTDVSDQMEFFLSSVDAGPAAGQSFQRTLEADGQWHTEVIDLSTVGVSTLNTDTCEINFIRMDFFGGASEGTMEVEYIAFFDNDEAPFLYDHTYKTYTVTFIASNQVVEKVVFEPGATSVTEPAVPEKEGYTGAWASYVMADKNFTVKAVYTLIEVETDAPTEPEETQPEEIDTEGDIADSDATAADDEATEPAGDDQPTEAPADDQPTEPAGDDQPTEAPADDRPTEAPADDGTGSDNTEAAATGEGEDANGCASVLCVSATLCGLLAAAYVLGFKKKH